MDLNPAQLGKLLILVGLLIAALGGLMLLLGRAGLFHLPGDLEFGGRNWRMYMPLASCIVLSVILTGILWLVNFLRK